MKKRGIKKIISFPVKLSQDSKAAIFTLGFAYLYLIAEIVYKVKVKEQLCTWEIILLFLMFSVYGVFKKLFSKNELPKDHKGNPLPNGYEKSDKKIRNSFYRKSSLIYSLIFGIITVIAFSCSSLLSNVNVGSELFFDTDMPNFVFAIIFALIFIPIVYISAYMIEYIWYEYKISLYNEMLAIKEEEQAKQRELLLKLQQEKKAQEEKETAQSKKPARKRTSAAKASEKETAAPKRRGRPPKKTAEETQATAQETVPPAPKRRGRPPKKVTEEAVNTAE